MTSIFTTCGEYFLTFFDFYNRILLHYPITSLIVHSKVAHSFLFLVACSGSLLDCLNFL